MTQPEKPLEPRKCWKCGIELGGDLAHVSHAIWCRGSKAPAETVSAEGPYRKGSCVSNTFKTSLVLTTDEEVEVANWCYAQGLAANAEKVARKGMYGWSVAYGKTLELRLKFDTYKTALEELRKTLDGCGKRQDEEIPMSELLLLRLIRRTLAYHVCGSCGTEWDADVEHCPTCQDAEELGADKVERG